MEAARPDAVRPNYRVATAAALAMAALVVLAVGTWMTGLWPSGERAPVARDDRERIERGKLPALPQLVQQRPGESLRRIDEMKSSLLALSRELDQLSRNASLLEERKQVSQLLSDYEQR